MNLSVTQKSKHYVNHLVLKMRGHMPIKMTNMCFQLITLLVAFLVLSTTGMSATAQTTMLKVESKLTTLASSPTRLSVALDGGVQVTVDSLSTFPEATVRSLVLAADRSTQSGCPYDAQTKGLISAGDRVVISDYYIAWIDISPGDGVTYGPNMPAPYTRSGELAGYWSLDPSTQMFKSFTNQTASNCWNWPRNELIPGSASPNGQKFWWDRYAPSSEHTISVVTSFDPNGDSSKDQKTLFTHNYSQGAANGNWRVTADGQVTADGSVYFQTAGRMASPTNQVDIFDNNDANGIQAVLESELEYYFRSRDILVGWRFSSSADVKADNVYIYYWSAYASNQDMDGTACDVAADDEWPGTTYTNSWFVQSSAPLVPNFATTGQAAFFEFSAGAPVQLNPGERCSSPYLNYDINSWQYANRNNTVVGNGTWLRLGEAPSVLSTSQRFMTYVHQMSNPNGAGNKTSPIDFQFNRIFASNETHDGQIGFGVASGPYTQRIDYNTLGGGKWYYALHALSTNY
jgi:hypothetical protein